MVKRIILFFIICCCSSLVALTQNVSDFSDYNIKYKEHDIVYLKIKTEVSVDIDRPEHLKIQQTKYEEIYYNNFKAGAFSEEKIQSTQFSKLKEIKASTLLPDNNKFKEVKVKDFTTKEVFDNDIFYQDLYSTSFIFPSLRQGAITKLEYTVDVSDPHFFPFEVVKRYYPVESYEFVINSDKDVEFDIKYFNADSSGIIFTREEKGGRNIYTWKAKDIKSYRKENRSPDYLCFLPQIVPYIKSYTSNSKNISLSNNIDDLFKWENDHLSKIDHRHTEEMTHIVNGLVKSCRNDYEKVSAIYKWVQDNIKYIANEYGLGGFIPRNPYQVFEKRYGDCKDMASLIIELLDIAGVKGYYTWVGTRNLPYSFSDLPTTMVTNHMIAAYMENNNYYLLDATNPYLPMGLPSAFIQGKECMIRLNDEKYQIYKTPEIPADVNTFCDSAYLTVTNGMLSGKGSLRLRGYYYSNTRANAERTADPDDRTKFMKSYLEKGNNKFVLGKYEMNTNSDNLLINYEFEIPDYIKTNNNELFVNMNLAQPVDDFEILKNDRQLDYEFYFKSALHLTNIFTIPENYEVNYTPKNTKFVSDLFLYSINYELNGGNIVYQFSMKINTLHLKPADFGNWNKMLKQMRSDFKEVVVLKKKV